MGKACAREGAEVVGKLLRGPGQGRATPVRVAGWVGGGARNLHLEAGAAGYIMKDAPASQLLYAIETVRKGERYLSPNVLKKVVDGYVKNSNRPQTSYDRLTPSERDILKLLAEGLTVKEIAVRLDRSVKTVEAHKHNLMKKIDVHDRTELIKYAIQKKLIAV